MKSVFDLWRDEIIEGLMEKYNIEEVRDYLREKLEKIESCMED